MTASERVELAKWGMYPPPVSILRRTAAQRAARAVYRRLQRDLDEAIPHHVQHALRRARP